MQPERLAVVGVSARTYCGVRDHGRLLGEQLRSEGTAVSDFWLELDPGASIGEVRNASLDWAAALAGRIAASRAQAVVFHYSVFSLAYRGVPVAVGPLVRALRVAGLPTVTVLHEVAYPWPRGLDLRGIAWATTQRAAARRVVGVSDALIVTADFRADWLRGARWLANRPLRVAPVFSNLPRSSAPARGGARMLAGIFGWNVGAQRSRITLEALAGAPATELRLLGSPGGDSDAADQWRGQARELGVEASLSFSGALASDELADELAQCDVLLYIDPSGPSGRKGTLAAMLVTGRSLVALEGRRSWPQLEAAEAVTLVSADAGALAGALNELAADPSRRARRGEAAADFYAQTLDVACTAKAVRELLAEL